MEILRDCDIKTFYKGLEVNLSKSLILDFIIKVDPSNLKNINSQNKVTKKELINTLKALNPSLDKLWKARDAIFKEGMDSLKADLSDIRKEIKAL